MTRALVCMLLLLMATTASAGKLYRYVDANGTVHYTDRPPTRGAKPLILDGSRPAITKRKWDDPAALAIIRNATRFAVKWRLPSPGQTYKDSNAPVLVVVSVMPGLVNDFGMLFYVNGRAQSSKPIKDIKANLHGIGAGRHQLVAALINHQGVEIARSKPVTIEIKAAATRP